MSSLPTAAPNPAENLEAAKKERTEAEAKLIAAKKELVAAEAKGHEILIASARSGVVSAQEGVSSAQKLVTFWTDQFLKLQSAMFPSGLSILHIFDAEPKYCESHTPAMFRAYSFPWVSIVAHRFIRSFLFCFVL